MRLGRRAFFVLAYHGVHPPGDTAAEWSVSTDQLRGHLRVLRHLGYEIVHADELVARLRRHQAGPAPAIRLPRLASITFDDALVGVHRHALAVLADEAAPATVFTVGDPIGSRPPWWPGAERTMTARELLETVEQGHRLGWHGGRHVSLAGLDIAGVEAELGDARTRFEHLVGCRAELLAYPFGHHDSLVREIARRAGFAAAFTFLNGAITGAEDRFRLPRLTAGPHLTATKLAAQLLRPTAMWPDHQLDRVAGGVHDAQWTPAVRLGRRRDRGPRPGRAVDLAPAPAGCPAPRSADAAERAAPTRRQPEVRRWLEGDPHRVRALYEPGLCRRRSTMDRPSTTPELACPHRGPLGDGAWLGGRSPLLGDPGRTESRLLLPAGSPCPLAAPLRRARTRPPGLHPHGRWRARLRVRDCPADHRPRRTRRARLRVRSHHSQRRALLAIVLHLRSAFPVRVLPDGGAPGGRRRGDRAAPPTAQRVVSGVVAAPGGRFGLVDRAWRLSRTWRRCLLRCARSTPKTGSPGRTGTPGARLRPRLRRRRSAVAHQPRPTHDRLAGSRPTRPRGTARQRVGHDWGCRRAHLRDTPGTRERARCADRGSGVSARQPLHEGAHRVRTARAVASGGHHDHRVHDRPARGTVGRPPGRPRPRPGGGRIGGRRGRGRARLHLLGDLSGRPTVLAPAGGDHISRPDIVFNALALRPDGGGVSTYCRELLGGLATLTPGAALAAHVLADAVDQLPPGMAVHRHPVSHGARRAMTGLCLDGRGELFHGLDVDLPVRRANARVCTAHDLSVFDVPWTFPRHRVIGERLLLRRALRSADVIIAVSTFTAERIDAVLGRTATVVPLAPAAEFAVPSPGRVDAVRRKHGLPERFVVQVGTVEPRKNLPALGAACDELGVPLVSVGAVLDPALLPPSVRSLGYVDRDELAPLYRAATVVAYPSVYEGFGLPPLEAMASGGCVLASRVGALAETCGDGAELVPTSRPDLLRDRLRSLLEDHAHNAELRHRGIVRARRFDWSETARATLAVYRTLGVEP